MVTETLSGKCPCCGYTKMVQRYGSYSYFQLDACPNCGFGYGDNSHDFQEWHEKAWVDFFTYILVSISPPALDHAEINYMDVPYELSLAYDQEVAKYKSLTPEELRRQVFQWAEGVERSDDIETTVWNFSEEDVEKYKQTNPLKFKQCV